jgi:uncharacterized membrane protein
MKSFEKIIRQRMHIQIVKALVIGIFTISVFAIKIFTYGSIAFMSSMDIGLLVGMFYGGVATAVRNVIKYCQALKSPELLDEMHIYERDERNQIIAFKSSQSTIRWACYLLSSVTIIVSFINYTVSLTLSMTLIALLILYIGLRTYYARKYQ